MANVFDVADYFIELFGQELGSDITNLKLNKLLYYAQGHCLATTSQPLFQDAIEAWEYGPVVPAIYQRYNVCGKHPIEAQGKCVNHALTEKERSLLLDVACEMGRFSASYLFGKTHEVGTPWFQTKRNDAIDTFVLKKYFKTSIQIPTLSEVVQKSIDSPMGRVAEDGAVILPAEEYDPADDICWCGEGDCWCCDE